MPFETIAKPPYMIERDHVVGFTKYTQYRAFNSGNHIFQGFGVNLIDLPFAVLGRTHPNKGCADMSSAC